MPAARTSGAEREATASRWRPGARPWPRGAAPRAGSTRTVRRVGSQAATRVTTTPTASPPAYQTGETEASPSRASGQRPLTSATTPWPSAVPTSNASDGRTDADRQRLDADRAEHLPPGRADAPQQREVALPLREQDGERVGDDQDRDEQRDRGEEQQHDRQHVDLVVRLDLGLLDLGVAGPHRRIRRDRADPVGLLVGGPGAGPGQAVDVHAVREVGEVRPGDVDRGVDDGGGGVDQGHDLDVDRIVAGADLQPVAELDARALGGVGVDRGLAGGGRGSGPARGPASEVRGAVAISATSLLSSSCPAVPAHLLLGPAEHRGLGALVGGTVTQPRRVLGAQVVGHHVGACVRRRDPGEHAVARRPTRAPRRR